LTIENRQQKRPPKAFGLVWQILYILYCLEAGIFLLLLPWMYLWDNNYLVYRYPDLRPLVTNFFVKGAVIGLGIVNLIIGIQEIYRFRFSSRRYSTR
jgi:hypothetical protein